MRAKLRHSVELIRKAEKIALMYDPENGFYNTFSGGKDSQELYYIVKMSGVRFQTHMSLTSVDPAEVVRFVNTQYPSVIPIRPKISIYSRAIERGILPTRLVRWCCADFKESTGAGKVTLIGIRKEESTRRQVNPHLRLALMYTIICVLASDTSTMLCRSRNRMHNFTYTISVSRAGS